MAFCKGGMATAKGFPATLPQAVVEDVKLFLSNYVEENTILLPGRIPGYRNDERAFFFK